MAENNDKDNETPQESASGQNMDQLISDFRAGTAITETHVAMGDPGRVNQEAINRKDKKMTELAEREKDLATFLRNGTRDNLELDAGILKEMGNVYYERGLVTQFTGHFVNASALYNAAWLRNSDPNFKREIESLIRQAELAFCKVLSLNPEKLPLDFEPEIRRRLDEIRRKTGLETDSVVAGIEKTLLLEGARDGERIKNEECFIEETRALSENVCKEVQEFFKYLLSITKGILGKAPQEHAIVGLGSLARGETTAYSDIEWSVLVADESKDLDYFRNMVRLVHLLVLNIRETVLKSLNIKSLNDYDTPGGNWFVDTVARRGFEFDSAAPFACKTPLGRPDRPGRDGIELIRTPKHMAQICEDETAIKEGYNFARVMTATVKIDGSEDSDKLFEEFKMYRDAFKSEDNVRRKAFSEIQDLITEFFPKLRFHSKSESTCYDIKKDLFRLPTLVISLFKTLFTLRNNNTWDILEEMKQRDLLLDEAARNLKCMVSIVVLLRHVVYSTKSHQNELMSLLSSTYPSNKENTSTSRPVAYLAKFKPLIFRYYYTILPFVEYLQNLTADDALVLGKIDQIFYEKNNYYSGLIQYFSCSYESARKFFSKHIDRTKSLSSNLTCLYFVAQTYKADGVYDAALKCSSEAVDMAKRMYKGRDHPDLVNWLISLGSLHCLMGDYKSAMKHSKDALGMSERIYKDQDHEAVLSAMSLLGRVYNLLGKYDLALQYYNNALAMEKRLYKDCDHCNISATLVNIGEVYMEKAEPSQSLQHFLAALTMLKKLHSDGDHPLVASILSVIGTAYAEMGSWELALQHFKDSMDMQSRIGLHSNDCHLSTPINLMNIGMVYANMGNFETALQLYADALRRLKKIYNADHPHTAAAMMNMGNAHAHLGNHTLALQRLEESLEMAKRIYSNGDHPSIAKILVYIGSMYIDTESYDKALPYLNDALAILKSLYSDGEHPYIATTLNQIGCVYSGMFKFNTALKFLDDALNMGITIYNGADHSSISKTLNDMGEVFATMSNHSLALQHYKDALDMARRIHQGRDHPDIASLTCSIASVYYCMKKSDSALEYLFESKSMFEKLHNGRDHDSIANCLDTLGTVYKQKGQLIKAMRYRKKAKQMLKRLTE